MNKHRFLTAGLVVLAMALAGIMPAWSLEMAPLNPAFLQYQQQLQAKTLTARTADGHGLGYIPGPFKAPQPSPSFLAAQRSMSAILPANYDLRNYSKVSPVKNQGNYGNCWAFATFGSMESCLLTAETWAFSENNLANKHGFDHPYGDGGEHWMSLAYLSRWSGPVLESADPYSNGFYSPTGLPVQKHIQSAQFIPDRTSATDNDMIKQAITNYGGMYSAFYYGDAYYNDANCAYYYNGSKSMEGNHAITIVGWDDAYSRTNFNSTPPGDGAFLIKNSWGTDWGNAGYFWISYYDSLIGKDNCLFFNAASTTNYESIYQYDTLGMCAAYGYGTTTAWGANIFSGTSGIVKAISFYALAADSSYEVRVYTGVTAGSPTSGTLGATKTGTVTYGGYYTVDLDSPVAYDTRFSVVVKFTAPGTIWPIPVESRVAGYSSAATAYAGESYMSANGTVWEAAYSRDNGFYMNCCIKAFGTGGRLGPAPASVLNDYDGDGKSDLAVYNSGRWYIYSLARNSTLAYGGGWGSADSIPVSGDYDGDGKSDLAVYNSGRWYIYSLARSSTLAYGGGWGGTDSIPLSGDYDEDGKSDIAVYQNSLWYIYSLAKTNTLLYGGKWGLANAIPLSGDYDGDGHADLAVYKDGYWYIYSLVRSATLLNGGAWGGPNSIPVSGDYDGDGKTDLAVYDAGLWYIYSLAKSSTLLYAERWGGPDSIPLSGDYDGDGKTDLAVYDAGRWYIYSLAKRSILVNGGGWGGPGSIPVQ